MTSFTLFKIDPTTSIDITLLSNLQKPPTICTYDEIEGFLTINNTKYLIINYTCPLTALEDLSSFLKAALKGALPYQQESHSIGLAWNNSLHEEVSHIKNLEEKNLPVNPNDFFNWAGEGLNVWSTPHDYEMWIYNEKERIIMEVTPVYGFHRMDKESPGYYPYSDFITNYKTIGRYMLTREQASEWLSQTEALIKQSTQNTNC